jgi:hypothetical protein
LFNGSASTISFEIGTVGTINDAGTEINDFLFSPGNPIFGIAAGNAQGGTVENGVITNVGGDPFAEFLNNRGTGGALNFNDLGIYANDCYDHDKRGAGTCATASCASASS